MKKTFDYILFHHPCNDGFLSFVLLHKFGMLRENFYLKGIPPDCRVLPQNIKGKDVVIIDLNLRKDFLLKILNIAQSVFFVDHHNLEILNLQHPKLTTLVDVNSSCCKIIWDNFRPNKRKRLPPVIKYIDDIDRMANMYPESSTFITAYEVHFNDDFNRKGKTLKEKNLEKMEKISKLVDDIGEQKKLLKQGAQYSLYKHQITKKSMNNFEGVNLKISKNKSWNILVSNIGGFCAKLVSSQFQMFDSFDCTMTWYYNCQIKGIIVLCRSKHNNIKFLLQKYGGDGHDRAGTFKFNTTNIYDWVNYHNKSVEKFNINHDQ